MATSIQLTAAQAQQLEEAAQRLNVTPQELATAAVRDLLSHGSADFEKAAARVLEKRRDLYRRLA